MRVVRVAKLAVMMRGRLMWTFTERDLAASPLTPVQPEKLWTTPKRHSQAAVTARA